MLKKRPVVAILLVLLVGIIVYANTFHVPFVLDDEGSITQNPVIRNLANFYANSSGYDYLPNRYIAFLSFALNYHFGGLAVFGYHMVNLVIHLLAAVLVYVLVLLSFRTPFMQASRLEPRRNGVALLAALLFVAHPVQTQAVTYVVQRMTSLATMFYLLSLALYVLARLRLEARIAGPGSRNANDVDAGIPGPGLWGRSTPILLLAGATISAVLAMFTKPIAFTLPLAILLYEACFFRGSWKRRGSCLLPLLATLPIVPMTLIHIGGPSGDILLEAGEQLRAGGISRLDYLFTQFRVIVTYLRLLILPVHQNLDYDYPVYTTFFTPAVFLSFLLLTAIVVLAVYLCRNTGKAWATSSISDSPRQQPALPPTLFADPAARLIAFGIFWFFLALSVESSLVPIADVIMEHRLYLPAFGAATAFSTTVFLLASKITRPVGRRLLCGAAVLLVVVLGVATWQRNHVWGNAIRLWQDVAAKSPRKGRPINNLGVALEAAGRRAEAFKTLSRAVAVDPGYYKSYYNLADLYLVSGQPAPALPLLQTAIRLKPDFTEAYVEMGAVLMRAGNFREVATFLERNLDRIGDNAEAHFYLGSAYAFLGNREAAMGELKIVSRHDQGPGG